MRYSLTHKTTYTYAHDVSVSHHVAHLAPRTRPHQQCLQSDLTIEPRPAGSSRRKDYFGNLTDSFTLEGAHRELVVTSRAMLDIAAPDFIRASDTPAWETVRDLCGPAGTDVDAGEFVFRSPLVPRRPEFAGYAAPSFAADRPVLEAVLDFTHRIHIDFTFDPKATTVSTPVEQLFKDRRGVCQDFAHLLIACLRSLGLPARYVSGYLETTPPPGRPKLAGADASHAWVQVFCGEGGWVDVDPTNDLLPGDRHITVAWGRDFSDVSPIRGVIVGGGGHELSVAVDVTPLNPGEAAST